MNEREQRQLADQIGRAGTRPIVIASHPRCGTHLLLDAIRLNLPGCDAWKRRGERGDRLYLNLEHVVVHTAQLPYRAASRVLARTPRPLVKTHAFAGFTRFLLEPSAPPLERALTATLDRSADVLYVYRDGRDAICSLYLLIHGRDPVGRPTLGEFLRQRHRGVSRPRLWAEHVRGWGDRPGTRLVRMEELVRRPAAVLSDVAAFLGTPPPARKPVLPRPSSLLRTRLDRLFATRPRSTAILGNNRPRQRLDWRSAFTPADRAFFHAEAGDLLVALGYEPSDRWADAPSADGRRIDTRAVRPLEPAGDRWACPN